MLLPLIQSSVPKSGYKIIFFALEFPIISIMPFLTPITFPAYSTKGVMYFISSEIAFVPKIGTSSLLTYVYIFSVICFKF